MKNDGVRKKLIEVALPLDAINEAAAREKSIRHGHPSTLHLWWARRPLAACRAVLFGQLVDDPGSWVDGNGKPAHPELYDFPTEDVERGRLFQVIREFVVWENSNNEAVLNKARLEVAKSWARNRLLDGNGNERDRQVLGAPSANAVNAYLAEEGPLVLDPFAGGGSIPLEAQRLGLRAQAQDLNPVAVLINKAMIEIPSKFAGKAPVNPEAQKKKDVGGYKAAQGLAEDVRYYGEWMRKEAEKKIGHLYPKVQLPKAHGGGEATVIAWLWCRTVPSPNPALGGVHVPLISSYWLSKKKGKEAWLEPVVDKKKHSWRFEVRQRGINGVGAPEDLKAIDAGTKVGKGDFRCILSGDPVPGKYIRESTRKTPLGARLVAVVAQKAKSRAYLAASPEQERKAAVVAPDDVAGTSLPDKALGFRVQAYAMNRHRDLFTARQLVALTTFSDLVSEARTKVMADARAAGMQKGKPLSEGGTDALAYADSIATYLACAVDKIVNLGSTLCTWMNDRGAFRETFARQALMMSWDFAEANPMQEGGGGIVSAIDKATMTINEFVLGPPGRARFINGTDLYPVGHGQVLFSTDPPYYDNIGYADLSDFFYVWLRRSLKNVHPELFKTALTPKEDELIASPYRHGGSKQKAERFFLEGMKKALGSVAHRPETVCPTAIYYAFKQTEAKSGDVTSTGWATFLQGLVDSGFQVDGTWPVRTESAGRANMQGANALASSIVLSCRKREEGALSITRREFTRTLMKELPAALRPLQQAHIAPVDMAQAAIGPGIAIFSRYSRVLEADGSAMSVKTALSLINKALDGHLAEQEGDLDSDTRFAVTWFGIHGFDYGAYGEAETLANARNVSVTGVGEAGILQIAAGKVRLLKRSELNRNWFPAMDHRPTAWECLQHVIDRLEHQGEQAAVKLMQASGFMHEAVHQLAYQLYQQCERKGDTEEARAYNGLVVAWDELLRLGDAQRKSSRQAEMFDGDSARAARKRPSMMPRRDSQAPGAL